MGIEEFLEKDTSYKPKPIQKSTGFLDGIINGMFILSDAKKDEENKIKRKAYEEGARMGYDFAWGEFRHNLTHPNSKGLSDKEYRDLMTIISRLGYIFDYILPIQALNTNTINTKYIGLVVRKNMDAYEKGFVVSKNIKEQIIKLINGNQTRNQKAIELIKEATNYLDALNVEGASDNVEVSLEMLDQALKELKEE